MYLLAVVITLISAVNGGSIEIRNHAVGTVPRRSSSRIFHGRDASIEEFPYIVELEYMGSHFCGGSIISAEFVLMAAHCVAHPESTMAMMTIRAGTDTPSHGGSAHAIERVFRHPEYNRSISGPGLPPNDVALLRVSPPFELDETRKPVQLYEAGEKPVAGKRAVVIGWGENEKNEGPDVLQAAEPLIVDYKDCHEIYSKMWGGLLPGQMCAGLVEQGACYGDSGGPLTIDGRQAGIVSGGSCIALEYPNVYTEVAYFRDWIRKIAGV